jgi:hypothetical protein
MLRLVSFTITVFPANTKEEARLTSDVKPALEPKFEFGTCRYYKQEWHSLKDEVQSHLKFS